MRDFRPRLCVDLGALRRNARVLKAMRPGAELMPVVKANAYGLGAEQIVPALIKEGCSKFFVAYPSEASDLRPVAGEAVFYVLNPGPGSGPFDNQCRPLHYRAEDLAAWNQGPCGVQIDIGMNRLGASADDFVGRPPREDVRLVVAHMSHSGNVSSPRNDEQRHWFEAVRAELTSHFPQAEFSLSASGGLTLPGSVSEGGVRPGVGIYGGSPGDQGALEPVATFQARVLSVHTVKAGETVGYDGQWMAVQETRVATLGAGYADGVMRSLSNQGSVFLGGAACPLLGRVSMDLITVDITQATDVAVGDWGEVFGPNVLLDEAAKHAGTIGYELLTAVGGRTIKIYRDSER